MTTTLQIPLPPSVNALYANVAGRGRVKTARYRTWINAAGWDVSAQRPEPVPGHIAVTYRIPWPTDKRRRDIGNLEKAISDLLVKHQLIDDDSKIVDLRIAYGVANNEGKAEVTIQPAPWERNPT